VNTVRSSGRFCAAVDLFLGCRGVDGRPCLRRFRDFCDGVTFTHPASLHVHTLLYASCPVTCTYPAPPIVSSVTCARAELASVAATRARPGIMFAPSAGQRAASSRQCVATDPPFAVYPVSAAAAGRENLTFIRVAC
jgi:hypothetical protein